MRHARKVTLYFLAGLCITAGAAGIVNSHRTRTFPFDLASADGQVIVHRIRGGDAIIEGDIFKRINGRNFYSLAEAQWLLNRVRPFETAVFTVQRNDSVFEAALSADYPVSTLHMLLVIILGTAFFALGLTVWRYGGGDPLVAAFLRLNILTGIAIVLESRYNVFTSVFLHYAYALGWMICYVLIPAAFLEFILRFTVRTFPRRRSHLFAVYAPSLLLIAFLLPIFTAASARYNPALISLFSAGMNYGTGLLLSVYFCLALALLLYVWRHAPRREEQHSTRWLLFCTFIGIAPFIFLHKLPTLWAGSPLISLDYALIFLPIAPIGWGMAVASFRLLKIERTLSRTLIYFASAGIVLYTITILATLGTGPGKSGSLIGMMVVAVFIATLAGLSLAKGIRGVVDRIYYGDWYNFRKAVQDVSRQLAGSTLEPDIVSILTEKIPQLLHIEKAILLMRSEDDRWILPLQRFAPAASEFVTALNRLDDLRDASPRETRATIIPRGHPLTIWGIAAALPLMHADRLMGCLLLGRKDSQSPYSIRDFELLRTLSSFSGMAIKNIQLHQELIARECRAVAADLAGGIAHEINNALHPLKGQAQWIEYRLSQPPPGPSSEALRSSIQTIVEMTDMIQRIADRLNHLSEPIRPHKAPMNLNLAAEDAIQILTETAGRIKRFRSNNPDALFQIRRDFDLALPEICADAGQIGQLFMNLILNAADAMEPCGRGVLTVGTRLNTEENTVTGYIEDTGIGIPPEYLHKIFQPYFTTKIKGKGTGIGLAIVRSIVESHNGKITVISAVNQGSRFEFTLPLTTPLPYPD